MGIATDDRLLVVDLRESLRHSNLWEAQGDMGPDTGDTRDTRQGTITDLCWQLTLCSQRSRTQHMLWHNILKVTGFLGSGA